MTSTYTIPTVEIDLNDASFLAQLLTHHMNSNGYVTPHLVNLVERLSGKVGC